MRRGLRGSFGVIAGASAAYASISNSTACEQKRNYSLPGIDGKVAIVSAAAQGIGRGICLSLAKQGAKVVCVDLPAQQRDGEETVRLVRELGSDALFVGADCADRVQIEGAFDAAIKKYGGIDISVSVVGGGVRGPFSEEEINDYEKTIALTQHSHWHWQQVAARHMCSNEGGCMVLVGSIMSQMTVRNCLAYQAAKAAVRSMGLSLAHELGDYGIRVNVLQPGYIDTPGERRFATEEDIQKWPKLYDIPAGRMGTPQDMGDAVSFLCSDAASYITGTVLNVDGGYLSAMALPKKDGNQAVSTSSK